MCVARYKDQIIIICAAAPPNEPSHCILTHFNNCNFSKAQIVCSLRMVYFTPKHVNFNANLKLFLGLSSCASVGERNLIINYCFYFIGDTWNIGLLYCHYN